MRELTDGRGVDCIVEIGGPGTIAMSLKALAVGGHVSLIGASLSSSGTGLDPPLLTGRGITLGSISVGSRAGFEAMNRAIALHRFRPVVDRIFPFAEAKAAYPYFVTHQSTREWIHPLSAILGALIDAGLTIVMFREHEVLPWRGVSSLVPASDRLWRLPDGHPRIPLSISVRAKKGFG